VASLKRRGSVWFVQWYENEKQRRRSLGTESLQVAREKLRRFESAQYRGEGSPLSTRTPVGEIVEAYIDHMRAHRPQRSWKRDLSHLRESFGQCCPALTLDTSRAKKCRELRLPGDRRKKLHPIAAAYLEEITTAAVSDFLSEQVRAKGLAPKTANRYREVIAKVITWAMHSGRVQMPLDRNPVSRVERYREHAPEIRFLTLAQIDEQLAALRFRPELQVMVATLIYAGLRREELLWLQVEDLVRGCEQSPNGLLRVRAKTVGGESWQPKTKKNRAVPVSRDLRRYLDQHVPRASEGGWLFPSPEGCRWHPDNFSQDLHAANQSAGLVWSSLDFRHTFGSQLAQRGVSLYQIATLMGNSPAICQRHYAAVVDEHLGTAVEFAPRTATYQEHSDLGLSARMPRGHETLFPVVEAVTLKHAASNPPLL
jgi:integrase